MTFLLAWSCGLSINRGRARLSRSKCKPDRIFCHGLLVHKFNFKLWATFWPQQQPLIGCRTMQIPGPVLGLDRLANSKKHTYWYVIQMRCRVLFQTRATGPMQPPEILGYWTYKTLKSPSTGCHGLDTRVNLLWLNKIKKFFPSSTKKTSDYPESCRKANYIQNFKKILWIISPTTEFITTEKSKQLYWQCLFPHVK